MNMTRVWTTIAAAVLLIGFWALRNDEQHTPSAPHSTFVPPTSNATPDINATPQLQSSEVVWSHGPDGSAANAEEHWEKHGREFPEFHSAREYELGALAFVTHPPSGALTKTDDRGDTLFYKPATNTFAVRDRRGAPRTFFRPDSGRAYWDRQ